MDLEQRRTWNENHKMLKEILLKPEEHARAIQLFLSQHALVHSSAVGNSSQPTRLEDLLMDLDERTFRVYPVTNPDTKNSIAWHLWHIARIEDMAMNILVADEQQVLFTGDWFGKINTEFLTSCNELNDKQMAELSHCIDLSALLKYRDAVGRKTQGIMASLKPGQFKEKVQESGVRRLFEEQALAKESKWLADYWGKKTIAGLILMPATRHNFLHLNKCVRIKEKYHKKMKNPRGSD